MDFQLFKQVRPGNSPKAEESTTRFATQFSTLVKRGTRDHLALQRRREDRRGGRYRAYVDLANKGAVGSGCEPHGAAARGAELDAQRH